MENSSYNYNNILGNAINVSVMNDVRIENRIGIAMDKFSSGVNKLEDAIYALGDKIVQLGVKIGSLPLQIDKSLKRTLMESRIGEKLSNDGINRAANFEADINKLSRINNISNEDREKIAQDILAVSNKTGQSKSDILQALNIALGQGVDKKEAINSVEQIGKAMAVGGISPENMGKLYSSLENKFGLKGEEKKQALDIIFKTSRNGGPSMDRIAEELYSLGENAQEIGLGGVNGVAKIGTLLSMAKQKTGDETKAILEVGRLLEELSKKSNKEIMQNAINKGKDPLAAVLSNGKYDNSTFGDAGEYNKKYQAISKYAEDNGIEGEYLALIREYKTKVSRLGSVIDNMSGAISSIFMPIKGIFVDAAAGIFSFIGELISKYSELVILISVGYSVFSKLSILRSIAVGATMLSNAFSAVGNTLGRVKNTASSLYNTFPKFSKIGKYVSSAFTGFSSLGRIMSTITSIAPKLAIAIRGIGLAMAFLAGPYGLAAIVAVAGVVGFAGAMGGKLFSGPDKSPYPKGSTGELPSYDSFEGSKEEDKDEVKRINIIEKPREDDLKIGGLIESYPSNNIEYRNTSDSYDTAKSSQSNVVLNSNITINAGTNDHNLISQMIKEEFNKLKETLTGAMHDGTNYAY